MIEAEFEEIDEAEAQADQLDLSENDSLPWLESDEDENTGGGFDYAQFVGAAAILLALGAIIIGGIWYLSNQGDEPDLVADGSTIEAPEGPYKVKPEEPGGKEFEGTGNVAPGVGEGKTPDGKIAESDEDEAPKPSVSTRSTDEDAGGSSAGSGSVVAVQVGAYGSESRAKLGWEQLTGSSAALEGVRYRIVKAVVNSATVYRLQALASDKASAERLCNALKEDGLPCQVKS